MRLIEMGVEPYLVASALTLVAAQRLARKLCDHCAEPDDAPDLDVDAAARNRRRAFSTARPFAGRSGARSAAATATSGGLPIFEIMPVTEPVSRLILNRAPRADIERLAVEEGMDTLRYRRAPARRPRRSQRRGDDAGHLVARPWIRR